MNIKAWIKEGNLAGHLGDLQAQLEASKVKVSLFGNRMVQVKGETVSLDRLVSSLYQSSVERASNERWSSPQERAQGLAILAKLENFYKESDNEINHSWFKRFCIKVRELFTSKSRDNPRLRLIDGDIESAFLAYSQGSFERMFSQDKNAAGEYLAARRIVLDTSNSALRRMVIVTKDAFNEFMQNLEQKKP